MQKLFIAVILLAITGTCLAQRPAPGNNLVFHNGHRIVMDYVKQGPTKIQDPVTEEYTQVCCLEYSYPKYVDGKKIYNNAEITTPVKCRPDVVWTNFEEFLLKKLSPDFAALPDGSYKLDIPYLVVDKRGRCIFQTASINRCVRVPWPGMDSVMKNKLIEIGWDTTYADFRPLGKDTIKRFSDKIDRILNDPCVFTPAMIDNKKVIAFYNTYVGYYGIVVKDRKVSLDKKDVLFGKKDPGTAFEAKLVPAMPSSRQQD